MDTLEYIFKKRWYLPKWVVRVVMNNLETVNISDVEIVKPKPKGKD